MDASFSGQTPYPGSEVDDEARLAGNSARLTSICNICGAKLSRPAHLRRHMRSHSTSVVKSFHCHICNRSFSRKDVYQRHKRSVHNPDHAARREGRRKSCKRCVRYKLRCSRETPCSACKNCPGECVYGWATTTETAEVDQETFSPNSTRAPHEPNAAGALMPDLVDSSEHNEHMMAPMLHHGAPIASNAAPDQTVSAVAAAAGPAVDCESAGGAFASSRPYVASPGDHVHASQDSHEVNNTDGTMNLNYSGQQHLQSFVEDCNQSGSSEPSQSHAGSWPLDLRWDPVQLSLSSWDTLFECNAEPQDTHLFASLETLGSSTADNGQRNFFTDTTTSQQDDRMSSRSLTREGIGSRALALGHQDLPQTQTRTPGTGFGSVAETKESWPGVLDQGGNETWPFDYVSNKGFRRIRLPPLREVLEQTVACRPTIQRSILDDLIKVLSAPHIPSLNETPALEAMPAVAFLGEFTRVYFAEFHLVFPVVHTPTWRIEKCPTVLLAAMACIGATYSEADDSSEVSALFAEITQRSLFWTGQQDSSAFRNTAYITAYCLHQIYALGTGNRRLYELADASRGLLVTSLRGLGVLSPDGINSMLDSLGEDYHSLKTMSSDQLEEAWIAWRDEEAAKRMAWAVFEFDSTLATMTSKKAAFRIAELPPRLPCSESIWEAHSGRAWAALLPFADSSPAGLAFYPLLREIMAGGHIPDHAPTWAVRLCSVAFGRLLYDLKEVQDTAAPSILGLPSIVEAHYETRLSLFTSLSALETSLGKPGSTSDVINMNVLSFTYHRSHLINSSDETMQLVISIFSNSAPSTAQSPERSTEAAKRRLERIFRGNPSNTRRLVFHAATIIAAARECVTNTPNEILSAFIGHALLLAYMRFFPFEMQNEDGKGERPQIRLDVAPWMRGAEAQRQLDQWIERGGSASIYKPDIICGRQSLDVAKQAALDTLGGMNRWGLARKFSQTIHKFA